MIFDIYPFTEKGPGFLLFMVGFIIGCNVLLTMFRRSLINACRAKLNQFQSKGDFIQNTDPYLVAYLKRGKEFLLEMIIFKLFKEDLLKKNGGMLVANSSATNLSDIERAVFSQFSQPSMPHLVLKSNSFDSYCSRYEEKLEAMGVRFSPEQKSIRKIAVITYILSLSTISLLRVYQSISHGHYNLFYLMMLSLFGLMISIYHFTENPIQNEFLNSLESVVANNRPEAVASSLDLSILSMAVLGVVALPAVLQTDFTSIFPESKNTGSSSSSSSSDSSSCSSSSDSSSCSSSSCSSSSCSSCGGGGCGGGGD